MKILGNTEILILVSAISESNRSHIIDILPLSERLKIGSNENIELFDIPFLQKYIIYAHKYVHQM